MTTDDGDDAWNGQERRASDRLRSVAQRELDVYSIEVLDYNRQRPRVGQRTPGEILREAEERMAMNKTRFARTEKLVGTILVTILTVTLTATITALWPWLSKLVGGH